MEIREEGRRASPRQYILPTWIPAITFPSYSRDLMGCFNHIGHKYWQVIHAVLHMVNIYELRHGEWLYTALVDWRRYLRLWLLIRYVSPESYMLYWDRTYKAVRELYALRQLWSPIIWTIVGRKRWWPCNSLRFCGLSKVIITSCPILADVIEVLLLFENAKRSVVHQPEDYPAKQFPRPLA